MSDLYNAIERTNANGGGTEYGNTKEGGGGGGSSIITIGNSTNDLTNAPVVIMYGSSTISTTNKIGDQVAVSTLGVYTIICGVYSADVTVTALGGIFNADVVTTDSWKLWVEAGGLDATDYDDLAEVLADEEAVRRLMTIHASVDFLANGNKNASLISTIINDNYCAKWINLRDYALDTLYANEDIAELMDTADKYGYGEWALVGQVPKMTSNTFPYGVAGASSNDGTQYEYFAFDGTRSTGWGVAASDNTRRIYYRFTSSVKIEAVSLIGHTSWPTTYDQEFCVEYSDNGSSWTVAKDNIRMWDIVELGDNGTHEYWAIRFTTFGIINTSDTKNYAHDLQFYTWGPKGNVPVMTSNTAPYGEVNAVGTFDVNYPWYAFDGNTSTGWVWAYPYSANLTYKFTNPVNVRKVFARMSAAHITDKDWNIEYSNDGTNWTKVGEITLTSESATDYTIDISGTYAIYWRISCANTTASNGGCQVLQFYGRELKVSVPTMTSNTAPYGEVSANSEYSADYVAWRAFDKNPNTAWASTLSSEGYIGYDFKKPVKIKSVYYMHKIHSSSGVNVTYNIQGYSNGNWIDLSEYYTYVMGAMEEKSIPLSTDDLFEKYRVHFLATGGVDGFDTYEVNFYGLDYSEYDWDTEHPRHYIYDHGVELEKVSFDGCTMVDLNAVTGIKEPDQLYYPAQSGSTDYSIFGTDSKVDITDYNTIRYVIGNKAKPEASTNTEGWGFIGDIKTGRGTAGIAFTTFYSGDRTGSLDVSTINRAVYLTTLGNTASGRDGTCSITEWWLE